MLLLSQFTAFLALSASALVSASPIVKSPYVNSKKPEDKLRLAGRAPEYSITGPEVKCGVLPTGVEAGKAGSVHVWHRLDTYIPTEKNLTPKEGEHKGDKHWQDGYLANAKKYNGHHADIVAGVAGDDAKITGLKEIGIQFAEKWVDNHQAGLGAKLEAYEQDYEKLEPSSEGNGGEKCWYQGQLKKGSGIDTIAELAQNAQTYITGKTFHLGVVSCRPWLAALFAKLTYVK